MPSSDEPIEDARRYWLKEAEEKLKEQMKRKEHDLIQMMRNPEDREPYPGDEEPGLKRGEFNFVVAANRTGLPIRYGNCNCSCHAWPGVYHFAPCCYPHAEDNEIFKATGEPYKHEIEADWGVNPYQPEYTLAEAVGVICSWLEYYNGLETPHVRDIMLHKQIADLIEDLRQDLGEATE